MGPFLRGFPTKPGMHVTLSYTRSTLCPTHLPLIDAITRIVFGKTTDHAYRRCASFWSFVLDRNVFFRTLFSTEVRNAYKIIVRKPVLRSTDRRLDGVGYIGGVRSAGSILYRTLAVLCAVVNLRCLCKVGSSLFINHQQNTLTG